MTGGSDRDWDSFDAYLFDVDGTLLNCRDAVHYFAFCDTLHMLAGRPLNLDGVQAHGNTDTGILRDALRLAGLKDEEWRHRLPEAYEAMAAHVQRNLADMQVDAAPFALEVLQHLRRRGALVGVATGNLEAIGRLKLERTGLLGCFDFGGYSDGLETRSDVFGAALSQAKRLAGSQAAVCVVGDTPADILAARANGLAVIAVATGVFRREQLAEHAPDLLIESFQDLPGLS